MRADVCCLLATCAALSAAPLTPPDPKRVEAIAGWLPAQPTGLGRPITDRATWDALAATETGQAILGTADRLLKQPLPEQPDDLYLDYSRTGNRTRWERVAGQRRGRVTPLVLAECLEAKGRFVPACEELVRALCAERTWCLPAHDRSLANFQGKITEIDLWASAVGWELSTAAWLLGDRLSAETRALLAENVERRVTVPYLKMVRGEAEPVFWMRTTNNWNAVCLAGSAGTVLAAVPARETRALAVAGAELHIRNFLRGFTSDGYCSEGMGYWNYGYGRFVLLAELLVQATGGQLDLLADPAARPPALFPLRLAMQPGLYPAFADCHVSARPQTILMGYLSRRYDLGLRESEAVSPREALGSLFEALIYWLPNSVSQRPSAPAPPAPELRGWFDQAGILVGRPAPGSGGKLAVALKGGHNDEHHNHNDVGSYVVGLGSVPVLLDPGAETYTARTFSARRYESNLLNSFGHPVPLVAGVQQRPGAEARGKVLATRFSDSEDVLRLDLASCYKVPALRKLEREWTYSRGGEGALTVVDTVEFDAPQAFGTALVTAGSWREEQPGRLLVHYLGETLRVEISTDAGEIGVEPYAIKEETSLRPTRLGINLKQPVTKAVITCRITPATDLPGSGGGLLRNGGFEAGDWYWSIPNDGLARVSGEQAASGKQSLHLTDREQSSGTNVLSSRFPLTAGRPYVLTGKVRPVSGSGIGLYVWFYSADGQRLNLLDPQGNAPPVGTAEGAVGQWAPFRLPFTPPPGTATGQLWIHSFNAAQVEAFLDDLQVEPGQPG